MPVILLLFVLIVYIVVTIRDNRKGGLKVTLREPPVQPPKYAQFKIDHGDTALERQYRADIYSPEKREQIWDMVSKVLGSLDDWQWFSREDFDRQARKSTGERHYVYEELVLAIMMAERGKLSERLIDGWHDWSFTSKTRTNADSIRGYQLARWFATKAREADRSALLLAEGVQSRDYGWDGTLHAATFNKDLTRVVPPFEKS